MDAFNFFGVPSLKNEDLCTAAANKGYDSIQFLQHNIWKNVKGRCMGISPITNYELVSTKLKGMYACASSDGKSSLIRKGWMGSEACECDEAKGYINCNGVPFLGWNPSRGLPAILADPTSQSDAVRTPIT